MSALNVIKPPVDIVEEVDRYLVIVDLPGVKPENVEIKGYDTYIEITGIREPVKSGNYILMERFSGKFKRKIHFKRDVDISSATATFRNGVLIINIPKSKGKVIYSATTIIIRR
ncbi:HSP20 family protein [Persephonella hydrogeniphila]|uniref:HSP20 family protein n=1 Tax=Persephonella hydrogeniphila TaxID=198703 RepID=A0A285NUQ7_9AQUI|nr:Hsp20/alpha crystallin family protein [Persephonella hydrogeniphila]SNZ11616.1 HSP20 family protein [Persephonella hydrogeniphila]